MLCCYRSVLASFALVALASPARAVEIRFNAFGDFSVAMPIGEPASKEDDELFKAHGASPQPVNTGQGFQVAGSDFVITADLNEHLTFQSEVNLQTCRGCSNELDLDVERMYLNYAIHPLFNFQMGLFFTPIGYQNRNLYARAWLMNSVQIHDFTEEELGLVPTHTIGAMVHGTLALGASNLMYAVSMGNGRASTPNSSVYARDTNPASEVAFLLEYRLTTLKNFRVGLSGWTDQAVTKMYGPEYGDGPIADKQLKLRDVGFNPYVVIDNGSFGLSAEAVSSTMTDKNKKNEQLKDNGWRNESFHYRSYTAEVVAHLQSGKLHPYLRTDRTQLPNENGGPFLSQRDGEHKYVPDFRAVMVGVAYDVFTFNRLKLEYIAHQDGPRRNTVVAQTAYGF